MDKPDEFDLLDVPEKLQINNWPVWGPRQLLYAPKAERVIVSLQSQEFDLLHEHSLWTSKSRIVNRFRQKWHKPTVISPHGTLEEQAIVRSSWKKRLALAAYEMENLRAVACMHASTLVEAKSFRAFGISAPIAVIPNGVSEEWLHSRGAPDKFRADLDIPSGKRVALYLSRIHPIKGIPLLLQAIAKLKPKLDDWVFVIAGPNESAHEQEIIEMSVALGISDLLLFPGPLFGQDKRNAFSSADLFILPSYSEAFGMVVVESLATGTPVLTTTGTPWQELLDFDCGWYVSPQAASIADALEDAITRSSDSLHLMGQRGMRLVQDRYMWSACAGQTIDLYNWLLGRSEMPSFVILE